MLPTEHVEGYRDPSLLDIDAEPSLAPQGNVNGSAKETRSLLKVIASSQRLLLVLLFMIDFARMNGVHCMSKEERYDYH